MASVSEESPASKAGLKAGDIILEFDGKKIETMRTLPKAVANTEVGKNVVIKIWRNKNLISKKLKLGRLESSKEFKEGKKKKETEKKKEVEVETLKIVELDEDYSVNDLLVHNKHDKNLAMLICEMTYDDLLPTPIGVFYEQSKPTYNDMLSSQIDQQIKDKSSGNLEDLIYTKNTWTVD